ncbi:MAG: alpha/beta hydrolase, partial [Solirubrobacteraceae bacterium]
TRGAGGRHVAPGGGPPTRHRAWGRHVVDEVIPRVVERAGADGSRVALGGISMGGFGAFDLARLHPGRFCAVGGHSPALWTSARQTAPGAFDGAADFRRHDVIAGASRLKDEKLWIDAGDADPFQPGDRAFVAALRRHRIAITVHTWSGGHEGAYWNRHFASYLRFYARRLAACAG